MDCLCGQPATNTVTLPQWELQTCVDCHQSLLEWSRREFARQGSDALWWKERDRGEVLQAVRRMTEANRSARVIAEQLKISPNTVLRMRQELGISGRRNRPWEQYEIEKAAMLFEDGCSLSEVARTVGRSVSSVRLKFPGQCWTQDQTNDYNRSLERKAPHDYGRTPNNRPRD
jgi:hypothetical protein